MVLLPSKVASLRPAGQAQALVTAESIVSRKAIMMICNGARVVAGSERYCGCAEVHVTITSGRSLLAHRCIPWP